MKDQKSKCTAGRFGGVAWQKAVAIFGSDAAALEWFGRENPVLGGSPSQMLTQGEGDKVRGLLERIENGCCV